MHKSTQNHKNTIFFVWSLVFWWICGWSNLHTGRCCFFPPKHRKNRWLGGTHGECSPWRAPGWQVFIHWFAMWWSWCASAYWSIVLFPSVAPPQTRCSGWRDLQFGLFWRELKLIGRFFGQCMIFLSEPGCGMLWQPSYLSRFWWWSGCAFLPCSRWYMLCNGWDWWARVMRLAYLLLVQKLEKEMSNSSNECCEVEDSHSHHWSNFASFSATCSLPSLLPLACCQLPSFFSSRHNLKAFSGSKCYWVIIYSTVIFQPDLL